jgi:hypothetical protein
MAKKQRFKTAPKSNSNNRFRHRFNSYGQVQDERYTNTFFGGPGQDPSVMGLSLGNVGDIFEEYLVDAVAKPTITNLVAGTGYTVNWVPKAGYDDYRVVVALDEDFTQVISGFPQTVTDDHLDVASVTTSVPNYARVIVMKQGFEASLESDFVTIGGSAGTSMYERFLALGFKNFASQEASGADMVASSGGNGTYVGTVTKQVTGLFEGNPEKCVQFGGAGYGMFDIGGTDGQNLQGFTLWGAFQFTNQNTSRILFSLSSTSDNDPGTVYGSNTGAQGRRFTRSSTNSIESGSDVTLTDIVDLLPHAFCDQIIKIGSNWWLKSWIRTGATITKLHDVDLGTSLVDIDINTYGVGAWIRTTVGSYAAAKVHGHGFLLGASGPSEAAIENALAGGTLKTA